MGKFAGTGTVKDATPSGFAKGSEESVSLLLDLIVSTIYLLLCSLAAE